jgi:ornithine carbamoyltransferase
MKRERGHHARKPLTGQIWAMLFSKASTRTRVSFDVGIRELGGEVIFLPATEIQLGRGEPIKDTARVLGRMVHGAVFRTYAQSDLEEFSNYSGIPTVNALTDDEHPCQILTDIFTYQEKCGSIRGKVVTFVGDGACNVVNSWIFAAARLQFELRIAAPKAFQPSAELLKRAGAKVVFGDIRDAEGQKVEATIRAAGGDATYVHLDVTSEADWQRAVQTATDRHGRLDILINNAAIIIPRVPIEDRTAAEWDQVMAVNAKGVFLGTKYAIPAMRRAGGGSIVNISSVAGIGQSLHQEPAYAASKGAIRIFTKVTASQHAVDKIRCNSVHPGPVDTEMFHSAFRDPEAMARRLQRIPLQRMGTVAEIVSAVLYLASDDSSYMTGSELVIDGGALAQ